MARKPTSTDVAENSESKELSSPATSNVPDFMRNDRSGKDNIDQDDKIIPRVSLMQGTHDEVEQGLVLAGSFWHTLLEEDLGEEIDDLVIVHHSKRFMLWRPRHEGGGVLARASDGRNWDVQFRGMEFEVAPSKDRPRHKVKWKISEDGKVGRGIGLGDWGTSDPENVDSQPAATLSHVLVCVSLSKLHLGPFVVTLQRTSEKPARKLLGAIDMDMAPIYGQVYRMYAKDESSPSGDYKQYAFSKNGHVQDQEIYERLKGFNEVFTQEGVKYNDATDDDGGSDSGVGDGGAADPNAKY